MLLIYAITLIRNTQRRADVQTDVKLLKSVKRTPVTRRAPGPIVRPSESILRFFAVSFEVLDLHNNIFAGIT